MPTGTASEPPIVHDDTSSVDETTDVAGDLWADFVDALPANLAYAVSRSVVLTAAVTKARTDGWNMSDLAQFCASAVGPNASSPGGIIAARLREAAGRGRPVRVSHDVRSMRVKGHRQPWCGRCTDDHARWRMDVDKGIRCDCWTPILAAA